jgi:hypothetical protein
VAVRHALRIIRRVWHHLREVAAPSHRLDPDQAGKLMQGAALRLIRHHQVGDVFAVGNVIFVRWPRYESAKYAPAPAFVCFLTYGLSGQ